MTDERWIDLPSDADASGRDLGDAEIAKVSEAIRSGTLTSTKGTHTRELAREFAKVNSAAYGVACNSGSCAVHAAVATLGLARGDEVITTAITDMGAIMPILYEGGIPVFCDVEADTANVSAATIAPRITPRTRAIIATHLFGLPCDMAPILELAEAHNITVIEDCAQAPLAEDTAGVVGTLGAMGCYSFQQGKHMTTGEGGAVITNRPETAQHLRKFVDKGWGYGEDHPDHDFPALNGRMSELQGAVGRAQLTKLRSAVDRRRRTAGALRTRLQGLTGVSLSPIRPGVLHSFWRFILLIDPAVINGGAAALADRLRAQGIHAVPHYIRQPAYRTRVFLNWGQHAVVSGPYEAAGRTPEPPAGSMPGTERLLRNIVVLPWNEHFTDAHIEFIERAIREAAASAPGRELSAEG